MEFIAAVFTVLCFSLFTLQTPCASLQIQLQPSSEQAEGLQLSPLPLPRKFRFSEKVAETVKENEAQHSISFTLNKEDVTVSGKEKQKEESESGGTRSEWAEDSQYFTMDYFHVRRRRPINNKSLPVGP